MALLKEADYEISPTQAHHTLVLLPLPGVFFNCLLWYRVSKGIGKFLSIKCLMKLLICKGGKQFDRQMGLIACSENRERRYVHMYVI